MHFNVLKRHKKAAKKNQTVEAVLFLVIFFAIFGYLASKMGMANMMNTLMKTSYSLLIETVFFLMAPPKEISNLFIHNKLEIFLFTSLSKLVPH